MEGQDPEKKNPLLDLISHHQDINKIYLYAKDPYEAKHKLLINKREYIGVKNLNDSKVSSEYSNDIDDINKNIEE